MRLSGHRPSPALVISVVALFVALGGVGMSATGDNFILGKPNSADQTTALSSTATTGPALQVSNNANKPAARFITNAGVTPFTVDRSIKVANLNADWLDGLNSTQFLRNSVPLSLTGSTPSDGVLTGTNTGSANGVQGRATNANASGVYGENTSAGGGYGVAGRSNTGEGIGVYGEALGGGDARGVAALSNGSAGTILATNVGGGPALQLQSSGPPMKVDSSAKVDNLNADKVDGLDSTDLVTGVYGSGGGRVIAQRATGLISGALLAIPGMGYLKVKSCANDRARLTFDTAGTGPVDLMYSGLVSNNTTASDQMDIYNFITTSWDIPSAGSTQLGSYTLNVARDTLSSTKIATIWVTWNANGCRFEAQAIQSPQL
jgi:hypothetical protein